MSSLEWSHHKFLSRPSHRRKETTGLEKGKPRACFGRSCLVLGKFEVNEHVLKAMFGFGKVWGKCEGKENEEEK